MAENKVQELSGAERKQIIEVLLPALNEIPGLPCKINLEVLDEKPPSMCIQQLRGAQKLNVNIVGGFTGLFPFAIWYRVSGRDTADRIEGTRVLNDISSFFSDVTNLPDLGERRICRKIEMTSVPICNNRHEDGTEDYMAIYSLEYQQKSKFE